MLTFINLVKIDTNRFWIRNDTIPDVHEYCSGGLSANVRYILVLEGVDGLYSVDLGRMMTAHSELRSATDILGIIALMTPVMLYTYQTDYFSLAHMIRSFMSDDLDYPTTISPYSIVADEESNLVDDPSYSDVIIKCSSYDLTNVFPVIGGKLQRCIWGNGKIFIEKAVDLVRSTADFNLISFGECEIILKTMSEMISMNWNIPAGYVPIVILNGKLFYDESIYTFDRSIGKLIINSRFVMDRFRSSEFTSVDEVYADRNSFVILVKAKNIFIRDVLPVRLARSQPKAFVCYEDKIHDHHVDYIGLDVHDNTLIGLTTVDEKYTYVNSSEKPRERHIYLNTDSVDVRIIQLVAS